MFRITDRRHADAMIAAAGRGLIVRVLTEQSENRDPNYLWNAWNVDRRYMAGVQVKMRAHQGLNHGKLILLYSQLMSIFGSSNWTSASTNSQLEHNEFQQSGYIFEYFRQQFVRKWNNTTGNIETKWFTPLPPDAPVYVGPGRRLFRHLIQSAARRARCAGDAEFDRHLCPAAALSRAQLLLKDREQDDGE